MGIWIGIDGGGTKTVFLAVDEAGAQAASCRRAGADVHALGTEGLCRVLKEGVEEVSAGYRQEDILGVCFGMPTYGENGPDDARYAAAIREALSPLKVRIVNDVEVGWAGAFALRPGVVLICGTGSMALGRDERGQAVRAGGWSEFFSDEGSGYWLGRKTLELFAKESDGRLPQGALYTLVRRALALEQDEALSAVSRSFYESSRSRTASLQRLLFEAAQEGDPVAADAYRLAAEELAMAARAVIAKLSFPGRPAVSYLGGVWNVGHWLIEPLLACFDGQIDLRPPMFSAESGAVLLACEAFAPQLLDALREQMGAHLKEGGSPVFQASPSKRKDARPEGRAAVKQ